MAKSETVVPEDAQKIADEISSAFSTAQEAYLAQEITLEEMIAQVREALDAAEEKVAGESKESALGGMGMNKEMELPEPEEE